MVDIDIEAASPYVDRTFVVVGVVDIVVACAVDTDLMEKSYLSVDEKKESKVFFFSDKLIEFIYMVLASSVVADHHVEVSCSLKLRGEYKTWEVLAWVDEIRHILR